MFSVLKMSDQSIGLIVQRVTFQGLAGWDQYPCGRWGDSQNPSYGALTDYQFMRPRSRDKKLQEWASTLRSLEDIHERFKNYCLGKLKSSPWSELEGLQPETKVKEEQLGQINSKGFLTINSQPAVNGVNPASPLLIRGWGGPGGYVYQKAYLEFFCSAEKLNHLVEKCNSLPSLTYIAVNKEGHCLSNVGPNGVNAVTWGVFPAKEIIQPTVVDPASFMVSGRMRYLRYGRENGHTCSLRMILRG